MSRVLPPEGGGSSRGCEYVGARDRSEAGVGVGLLRSGWAKVEVDEKFWGSSAWEYMFLVELVVCCSRYVRWGNVGWLA